MYTYVIFLGATPVSENESSLPHVREGQGQMEQDKHGDSGGKNFPINAHSDKK